MTANRDEEHPDIPTNKQPENLSEEINFNPNITASFQKISMESINIKMSLVIC